MALDVLVGGRGGFGSSACDAAGERLAWWFGITSPKYYYEIQEALRMKDEEEARKKRQDAEMAGWSESNNKTEPVLSDLKPDVSELKMEQFEVNLSMRALSSRDWI